MTIHQLRATVFQTVRFIHQCHHRLWSCKDHGGSLTECQSKHRMQLQEASWMVLKPLIKHSGQKDPNNNSIKVATTTTGSFWDTTCCLATVKNSDWLSQRESWFQSSDGCLRPVSCDHIWALGKGPAFRAVCSILWSCNWVLWCFLPKPDICFQFLAKLAHSKQWVCLTIVVFA